MSEIKTIKYSKNELNDAIAIVGFPTVGLIGSIVCSYIIKELKMPVLMGMTSEDMNPYCILIEGEPYPPVRVHGFCRAQDDDSECGDLMVITSEIAPNVKQCYTLTDELLDMFKEYGIKKVICIEGIPRFGEDARMYACGSTPDAREIIKSFDVESLNNGMIKGLPGVMLFEGRERGMDIIALLCPADDKLPDPRAAVRVVEELAKVVPELKNFDTAPLVKEAEELEKRILAHVEQEADTTPEVLPYDQHLYG
ncbi:MAG TPA: PAC2 family protein [Candidatus Methanomethylophilaceae archaeon]|nr:PAC2 family protein [Candidatus Methanomethylophilaceae archaeon]